MKWKTKKKYQLKESSSFNQFQAEHSNTMLIKVPELSYYDVSLHALLPCTKQNLLSPRNEAGDYKNAAYCHAIFTVKCNIQVHLIYK